MVSWTRNNHSKCSQILIFFFMIYLVMLYCLQFMTVGAIFVSIMVFFKHIFELMFSDDTHGATMQDIQDKQLLQ